MKQEPGQTGFDKALSWALGGCVAILAWISGNSIELPPELWNELSFAAKLRPPATEFPALWRVCVSLFIERFGVGAAINTIKLLGPISLGVSTALTYRLMAECLPSAMKTAAGYTHWGRQIIRFITVTGTVFFVCSEPVWLAGRVFSPEMLALLTTEAALLLAITAVNKLNPERFIVAGAVSGVLAADTPAGFLIPVMTILYCRFTFLPNGCEPRQNLLNPITFVITVRRSLCTFTLCLVSAMSANIAFFRSNGGGGEDADGFVVIMKYLLHYFEVTANAMSPLGWLFVLAAVMFPLAVMMLKKRALTDMANLMNLSYAGLMLTTGMLAFMQSTGFSSFHFWKWEICRVGSSYFICLCLLATSVVALNALSVAAIELYFRNHTYLLRETFPYENGSGSLAANSIKSARKNLKRLHPVAPIIPFIMLACVIPFKFDTTTREIASIVNDIVYATARECAGATMLFTDGSYDAAVETASAELGHRIKALSFMSGAGEYDVAIRLRGEKNNESIDLLKIGTADAMRTWVHGKYDCVSNIAVQVGFELWQQNGIPPPRIGGFAARTKYPSDSDAMQNVAAAREIIGRIIAFLENHDLTKVGYASLNRLFIFGQWRLARMCRMRADQADRMNDEKLSEKENELAHRLNELNPELRELKEMQIGYGSLSGVHLTPREGLQLGLARADFRIAGNYAQKILATSPADMLANFAVGMLHLTEKRYGKAEIHLKKCLEAAPDAPTVLNNLAVVQLRLGKLSEAEANANKALRLHPKSKEIKATLRGIENARKEKR